MDIQCYYEETTNAMRRVLQSSEFRQLITLVRNHIIYDYPIYICGNGGCASLSSHFVIDLVKRCRPYSVKITSLTDNIAVITAHANDEGYEKIFSNQLIADPSSHKLVICLSTSGNSPNVVEAAKSQEDNVFSTIISITGNTKNTLSNFSDLTLKIDSDITPVVEDVISVVLHVLAIEVGNEISVMIEEEDND